MMRDLTEGISARGIRCDMLCAVLPSATPDPKDAGKVPEQGKTTVITLNGYGSIICVRAWGKLAATMIAPAMVRYLKEHAREYDLIHIHHPDPMAALALRLSGYKGRVIVHWHSDIVSRRLLLWLYLPLQNWMLRRAGKIAGTTPVYVRESPHLRKYQDKCTYVPIGIHPVPIDEGKVQQMRRSFLAKYHLLSVGRLVPYKGYEYLIEAMRLLPDDYELQIVGEGPLRRKLEMMVQDYHLEHRVSLSGYLPEGEEFNTLFGSCDLFVLPSVMKTEAFGIVQIEAMSCGKPVVSTRIPGSGVSWVNQDGVSGLNVPPRDARALADAIKEVIVRAGEFGKAARLLYEERYTYEGMINKALTLYENE